MALQLGAIAPDFEADTTVGKINFHSWLANSWGVLFSHPKDYTPVCTTELGAPAKLKGEFEKRGAKVEFPMIADPDLSIANLYGMIHPNASDRFTVRSVFVIDPKKKVRLTLNYPASTGRNFDQILRVIDSLQLTDQFKVATPVNSKQGQHVIIVPSVNNDDARKLFPGGWNEVKPYLRVVPQPRN
jgi:alkyl hydroperoxide reductase subunit AhpC